MIELAKKERCTACGACAYVCAKQCITMKEDELGAVYPVVDESDCISCGKCQKVCPILSPVEFASPIKAYAAWSANADERRISASGGVAAEVYNAALDEGWHIAGAKMNEDFSTTLQVSKEKEAVAEFKNSKYVFSSAYELFPEVKRLLDANEKVVIIGLPCQVAAFKSVFRNNDNLLLMDGVCHGVAPTSYLQQHIKTLEKKYGEKTAKVYFRDPALQTNTFTFTLYNEQGKRFCAQRIVDGDTYQYAYHRAITYRENCYHCAFAKEERVADATLSDYKGLGRLAPCSIDPIKVSSFLIYTRKGEKFAQSLIDSNRIVAEERPVKEPINADPQLRHPSIKTKFRFYFETQIAQNKGDFEKSVSAVMKKYFLKVYYENHFLLLKRIVTKIKRLLR